MLLVEKGAGVGVLRRNESDLRYSRRANWGEDGNILRRDEVVCYVLPTDDLTSDEVSAILRLPHSAF